jgi:hypothetical protein
MTNMWKRLRTLAVLAGVALLPAVAHAQATLAGTVQDASGGVLPGVTVEASSPVLIEKVRSAITDGTGQYRITELPPGAYIVTFTLPGFVTIRREQVAVSGSGVITIGAEMRVGGIQETITVTGETPVVDIQSTRRQSVLDNEIINVLPATRGYGALLNAVPALQGGYLDSQVSPAMTFFNTYGGRPNEGRVQVDGLNVGAAFNGGGVSGFAYDTANAEEMQVTLSGGLGEMEVGGASVNIIPRTGGNTFAGTAFMSGAGEWSQGNNIDDRLRSFGITDGAALVKNWDASGSYGGPIKRDRLWFFGTVRNFGQHSDVAGRYANANAGDPTKWTYVANPNVKARTANATQVYAFRLTSQVTPRNKVGFYLDHQFVCAGSALVTEGDTCRPRGSDWIALGAANASPEATTAYTDNTRQRIMQITWTSPATNRLLLEAGYSGYLSRWGWMEPPGALTNLTPVTELSASVDPGTGQPRVPVPFFTYRGLDNFFDNKQSPHNWRASASYVTGAHNMKFGYQGAYYIEETEDFANATGLTYTFLNGAPSSFGWRIAPWQTSNRTSYYSLYAQDQWTLGRVTLQGALRYDHAWSFHPAEHNGAPLAGRFNAAPITFPRTEGVKGYNDITPRMGAAWDVFGTGKTALKANLGKYLQAAVNQTQYTINNPALDGRNGRGGPRFVTATTRNWNDVNGNRIPDCNILNPLAQDNSASGGDTCGAWANPNFGNAQALTIVNPEVLEGWGVRPHDWHLGLSVQQELLPRVSVEVGYNRRWYGNFFVTDNRNVGPADYDPWTVTAPLHPELPGGGGYSFTQYNIKPAKFGQLQQNYYTFETDFGPARTQYWHGIDVNLTARPRNGLMVQGGTSTGRGVRDTCDTVVNIDSPDPRNCHVTERWITSFRGLAAYTVPRIDVLVSAIVRFQTTATGFFVTGESQAASNGGSLSATYPVPNTVVQQSLGRLPSGGLATGTTNVNLLLTGELYPEQIRTVDMRFAKILRFGNTRTDVGIDLQNLLNANTATAYNQNFGTDGATWLRPTAILNPRFLRFNVTVNF